jgi:hydrophobe/amphiphile efflux-1 (HAE1) family protein
MRGFLGVFIERPVFTWVLALAVVVFGGASFRGLPVERYPNAQVPVITVTTFVPGMSAEQIESEVTTKIENALGTVGGLERVDSTSQDATSVVVAQFTLARDVTTAAQDVRDRVARIGAELPPNARAPQVEAYNPNSSPIMLVALSAAAEASPTELARVAETTVQRELASVSGVGEVRLVGASKRTVFIDVDPVRLAATGLDVASVRDALARESFEGSVADVPQGASVVGVRLAAKARTVEELDDVVVATRGSRAVRVRDVATTSLGPAAPESTASLDDRPVVVLAIVKQSGANTVAVADEVTRRVEELTPRLPNGMKLTAVRDDSGQIRASLHAVEEHLVLGSIFAALVVLVFLRSGRATVISALAIPTSVVGTFAAIHALGLSINMMTLLGLTLAVGIVIDDAVVVIENVYRILQTRPLDSREAALEATQEIALAVLATTLSLVAVFLPIAFMGGIVGRFLSSFGWTMSISILLSMAVAFTLTPMLCGRWLKRAPGRETAAHAEGWMERTYERALRFCLRRPGVVAVAIVASVAATVPLLAVVPTTFLPVEDEGRFEVYLRLDGGASVESTALEAGRIARQARALPGVTSTLVMAGSPRSETRGPNEAVILVTLAGPGAQAATMERVRSEIAPRAPSNALVMVAPVSDFAGAGPDGAGVQLVVTGPDLGTLTAITQTALARARAIPLTTDHGTTAASPRAELRLAVDRARARAMGVALADVDAAVTAISPRGVTVGALREDDTSTDVRLRLLGEGPPSDRLRSVSVRSERGSLVPVLDVTRPEDASAPTGIRRAQRARQITVFLNTLPGADDAAIADALRGTVRDAPPGYRAELLGNAQELERSANAFRTAILLSLVFMYLVLAAQFESFLHPLTILASIPLTIPFALFSLWIFGQSLNVFSALGFLVLFGIVKKNAILQVDHTLALQRRGLDRTEALVRGSKDRLRPILMTTAAFVAGLVPLVVSSGPGSATNRAIAVGVMGGQLFSLALTLLATPVIFVALARLRELRLPWRRPVEAG